MQLFISSLMPIIIGITICLNQIEAKRSNKLQPQKQCQLDECNLRPQHYALYSFVKEAIDSRLDLNGKEIYPFLKSVEILRRRFSHGDNLNGTKLVKSLLANGALIEAERVFKSEQGSALVDLYRSPVNGRSQNLACSQLRVQSLERASRLLATNPREIEQVFAKIHRNFMRKSAKKCLKHSCNSIETSMSKLQSVLGVKSQDGTDEASKLTNELLGNNDDTSSSLNSTTSSPVTSSQMVPVDSYNKREFEPEELELCKFFKRTNATDCRITGNELSEISLLTKVDDDADSSINKTVNKNLSLVGDLLKAYRVNYNAISPSQPSNNNTNHLGEQIELNETGRIVLNQCRPIRSLLDYNLAAIKWYRNRGLIDNQKLTTRSFWCPSLAYWLQLDRLCGELELSLESFANNGTFSYEVSNDKQHDLEN